MGRKPKDDTLPLFDYPLSRNRDPLTSFLAADRLAKSGKYLTQKGAVLEALKRNNGDTSAELAAYMGVSRHLTARRLPDLERDGLVEQGFKRQCRQQKTLAVTWWIAGNNSPPRVETRQAGTGQGRPCPDSSCHDKTS